MKTALLFLAVLATAQAAQPKQARYATGPEALYAARLYALLHNGEVVETSGTPSMRPLIVGKVYAVAVKLPYERIGKSDLLVYRGRPDAAKVDRTEMLHRAVAHDRDGWIMSGDNNRWTESWDRVTPATYLGTVVALFAFNK